MHTHSFSPGFSRCSLFHDSRNIILCNNPQPCNFPRFKQSCKFKSRKLISGKYAANGIGGTNGSAAITATVAVNRASDDELPKEIQFEYYEPKTGDLVTGVVVSAKDRLLRVDIGSKDLAVVHCNEISACDMAEYQRMLNIGDEDFSQGKRGILSNKWASLEENPISTEEKEVAVEEGTVIFANVLGRTLSGLYLLSPRRAGRRIAWQRLRQLRDVNEPIEIHISEWNAHGLISRIEGLRAFLPKSEIVDDSVPDVPKLKEKVGSSMFAVMIRVDEASEELIVSERIAWKISNIFEGNVLQGTVKQMFSFGAQVQIDGTKISGLLHISNISHARVHSVSDLFSEGERVKVMVIPSRSSDKINFSTSLLESEKGLILSNKKKVFEEADEMANAYRNAASSLWRINTVEANIEELERGEDFYANWDWFQLQT